MSKISQAKLWIVGKYPTRDILALRNKQIEVSDDVEDIQQAYAESHILLAPIYGSGGTRYKILEAMACGVPVVTTPEGIEGLGVRDGQEALIRSDTGELALATIKVLTDGKLYSHLAENANKFVRLQYNWKVIAAALDHVYEAVAHETN